MPSARTSPSGSTKTVSALTNPGLFLMCKYNEYKRQQQEERKRKVTEKELELLNNKIYKLLGKLDDREADYIPCDRDEECVICFTAKATMQTFPCEHKVICRRCFIKTVQSAVTQRSLPLRCVICRSRILKLRRCGQAPPASSKATLPSSCCRQSKTNKIHPK